MKTAKQIERDAKRLIRLCRIDNTLNENNVRLVVQNILGSKRRGHLELATRFERLVRLEFLLHQAKVESATTLSGELQDTIQANLIQAYGPQLRTSFVENPMLIGGMRVSVGSDVYDGSIRAGLSALENSFCI